jgi:phosphoglycerate kinase
MNDFDLIPKIQDADLSNKIVLVRVDHNVVKKGEIKDTYRIDVSMKTINYILEKGGKPIIMTHIGRPKNKKTGEILISEEDNVQPIIQYLHDNFGLTCKMPDIVATPQKGYTDFIDSINPLIDELKNGKFYAIYMPNTRFFAGEEDKGDQKKVFAKDLASIADIFVNDAFGSWQPHASTVGPVGLLPSYAGFLMQSEVINLEALFKPKKPFLGIIAGSKFDTKIRPLQALIQIVDHLLLGGVILNAYIAAKYGFSIKGISDEDMMIAKDFVNLADQFPNKVLEPEYIVESDSIDGKYEGKYRTLKLTDINRGAKLNYILDIGVESYQNDHFKATIMNSETIFVNAVMGLVPLFCDGTTFLYKTIDENKKALKLFGGGDTLQEFKNLLPELYNNSINDENYYFFTGGGTILTAIEQGSPWNLDTLKVLIDNAKAKKQ